MTLQHMAEDAEFEALKGVMSPGAWAQHQELVGAEPGRDVHDLPAGAKIVYLSIAGKNRHNNSQTGQSGLWADKDTTPFAQVQLASGKCQFISLDDFDGKKRYLKGYTTSPGGYSELVASGLDQETMWNVTPYEGGYMLSLDGPGPKRFLSDNGLKEALTPYPGDPWEHAFAWNISDTPSAGVKVPPVPPAPPPVAITVQTYGWGFHFVVPEALMQDWTGAGLAVAEVVQFAATFAGPAAVFVEALGEYLEAEFDLAKAVDKGNGVYVSMSWFAPALFVPTPI